MTTLRLLLALFLALAPALQARHPSAQAAITALEDGPYVLWNGEEARILRVSQGRVLTETRRGPFHLALPMLPYPGLALGPGPMEPARAEFEAPERIFALSDIHGRLDSALRLLQAHRVVDRLGHWSFGRGHLVVVGDTMDRGPQVTEACWFFRGLEEQALKAGGRVHLLLGNHELLVMGGHTSYLHPKYAHPPAGLPDQGRLYGPESDTGRWLRTRPTLLRLGPFLFVHGGISPSFLARGLDLARANRLIREGVGQKPLRGTDSHFLLNAEGPLWYRGFLPGFRTASTGRDIEEALGRLKARAFVVGHTTLPRITAFHGGRVYGIDAGLKDGRPGEGWLWQGGKPLRALADGHLEPLTPADPPEYAGSAGSR